jgi:HSP20 family protein
VITDRAWVHPRFHQNQKEKAMTEEVKAMAEGVKEASKPKTEEKEQVPVKSITPSESTALKRAMDSPFTLIRRFADEMDRLFEDFGFGFGLRMPSLLTRGHESLRREPRLVPAEWSPRVDILEREGQVVVRADLPGLTKDDIKVELTDNLLTLQGERKLEKKEEREGYYYNERFQGTFYRSIPLPEGVDASKATAEFRNGVLEVAMPAPTRPESKSRRLEISEGK